MPGKVADLLRTTELEPTERAALDQGVTVQRGQRAAFNDRSAPNSIVVSGPRSSNRGNRIATPHPGSGSVPRHATRHFGNG
ncbi:hypothetical protein [Streptomyces sp. IMTB 2501]|uniref:hypothetical protein n=1 Tax=Streptomyces sp. IMTB 2501 TaxID=1776340 RepID=UPI000D1B3048|nr:hypothetical protein [Streptomyces sp. IMTB 2501]